MSDHMPGPDDRPVAAGGYRNPADACLARAADAVDFAASTTEEATAAAERRVDPLKRVLAGLLRGLSRR